MFVPLPKKAQDLTGNRYGFLTAAGPVEIRRYKTTTQVRWLCRCDCGSEPIVSSEHLRSGHTRSCGCRRGDLIRQKITAHGKTGTPEYLVWAHIKGRCENGNDAAFHNYGGRGIRLCKRWQSFENFLEDMGPRPPKHSIDRIDVNGNYEPGNCRWATAEVQANNRRGNHRVTIHGVTKTIAEWAKHNGWRQDQIDRRIRRGFSDVEAVTRPLRSWPKPRRCDAS